MLLSLACPRAEGGRESTQIVVLLEPALETTKPG
jgi:hypothetical protein